MDEFETTVDEQERERQMSSFCIVYDKRDGRVVHVHEFVGDGTGLFSKEGAQQRSQMALEIARQRTEPRHLATLHTPTGFRVEREKVYRVDLSTQKLVAVVPRRPAFQELVERRMKNL